MQDIFTALCGRWWRVKVRFAGFLFALPLQNRRKARVEQPQVRARLKFASVCKFELAQRLVVKGFCPCEPLRKAEIHTFMVWILRYAQYDKTLVIMSLL